tara:strand:- start:61 stop:330 length:270 start_codon:yes stop_codon:yes gene_type:complete
MDPLTKLLYYESFLADLEEKHDFARSYAIFTGSFTNMDMAQRIVSEENPDYESTEEDFAESTRMVLEGREKAIEKQKKKRRRRRVVNPN